MDRSASESAMVGSATVTDTPRDGGDDHGRQDTEATTQAEETEGAGALIPGGSPQRE